MTKTYIKHAARNQTEQQKLLGIWSGSMSSWENRFDCVVTHAWEAWTQNGLGLDQGDREQTIKSVQDAVNNVWIDGMTEVEWMAATLQRLGD